MTVRARGAFFAALLVLLFVGFLRTSPARAPAASGGASGEVEAYFTRPNPGDSPALRGGPAEALARAIDAAGRSVDMAIYRLDLDRVRDALLAAHRRGVAVRLVVESDNLDEPAIHALLAAGVPVVGDGGEALMHDKFTVIDGREVWTGSMNYTVGDAYFNDNNLLRLVGADLAEAYREEFDEMFQGETFGAFSLPGGGRRVELGDGTTVEVYFAPDDRPLERLVTLVGEAGQRVDFLAFAFTSSDLAQAMIERSREGVAVRGVVDAGQAANLGSQWEALRAAGLDVRLDGNPDNMHHKVIVIDAAVVVTGSYNFSRSAETLNDENLVVLHDPALARLFLEEVDRVYGLAR